MIEIKKLTQLEAVPTPAEGELSVFRDAADSKIKVKEASGEVRLATSDELSKLERMCGPLNG